MKIVVVTMVFAASCGKAPANRSPEAIFTEDFADRLREASPTAEVRIENDLHLLVKLADDPAPRRIYLDNAFRETAPAATASPADFKRRLASIISPLPVGRGEDELIVACVRAMDFGLREGIALKDLTRRRIVGDLYQFICINGPESMAFADSGRIASMTDDVDALFEASAANVSHLELEVAHRDLGDVTMVVAGGDYEASLIFREDVWATLTKRLGPDLIFTVSNRDLFMVAPAGSAEGAATLREQASRNFAEGSHAISPRLYRYSGGVLSVFERRAP